MKKIINVDVFFELETKENEDIRGKAWEYINSNLSEVFSTEGSELTIYNLNGEEYFEDGEEVSWLPPRDLDVSRLNFLEKVLAFFQEWGIIRLKKKGKFPKLKGE